MSVFTSLSAENSSSLRSRAYEHKRSVVKAQFDKNANRLVMLFEVFSLVLRVANVNLSVDKLLLSACGLQLPSTGGFVSDCGPRRTASLALLH